MYIIGLIDDEETQLKKIRRTIKTNAKTNEQYDFKSYLISDNASDVISEVFEQVINDIRNSKLSSLIVDYKIIVKTSKIKGTDIFKRIKDLEYTQSIVNEERVYIFQTKISKFDTTIKIYTGKENISRIDIENGVMTYILKYKNIKY